VKKVSFFISAILLVVFSSANGQIGRQQHAAIKNTILLNLDTTLDSYVFPGFSASLASHLERTCGRANLGVRKFTRSEDRQTTFDTTCLVLTVAGYRSESSQQGGVRAAVAPFRAGMGPAGAGDASSPLVDVLVNGPDTAATVVLVAQKIEENLRSRYVRRIVIRSAPEGACVRSSEGMKGVCPVAWDAPFGIIGVEVSKKGFLTRQARYQLSNIGGADTVTIALSRRMFYHSRLFNPAIACVALSAACYGLEYYYYDTYKRLGPGDLANNPGAFGSTFTTAQTFGYAGSALLGIGCCLLVVTFFW
jgi:hypothetical protein